jgi:hypothetical protein
MGFPVCFLFDNLELKSIVENHSLRIFTEE